MKEDEILFVIDVKLTLREQWESENFATELH
jgi:hypothetical protein